MKLSTHLSRDRFGWMQSPLRRRDHALVLVRVTSDLPADVEREVVERPASHLVVVLDRSGSMSGERLDGAKRALVDVVRRLGPGDSFGLVTFDSRVEVVVPAGPIVDPDAVVRRIESVRPGGSTDLGAGLVRGLEEARRLDVGVGVRVLLVSDGHANQGVVDPDALAGRTAAMLERGVTTSTLGVGLGYDEGLLSAIARAGSGNQHFATGADDATGAIAAECGELLEQRFLSCRLTVVPASGMRAVEVVNDAPVVAVPGGFQVDLGGMRLDESRSLVLEAAPHTATRPGRRKIAKVRVDYVLADDLTDRHVSTTVWTHVSRPTEREGAVDRDVLGEWYVQRVLRRRRKAALALAAGDVEVAVRMLERVAELARHAAGSVPRHFRDELLRELAEAEQHAVIMPEAHADDLAMMSKSTHARLNGAIRRRS